MVASFIFDGTLGTGEAAFETISYFYWKSRGRSEAIEAALREFEVDSDTFEVTFKAFEAAS